VFVRPHFNQCLGAVVGACHPSYEGRTSRRIKAQTEQKVRHYLQNTQSKRGWRCGSNDGVTTLQVGSPEIKPLALPKAKKLWNLHLVLCTLLNII
jgi:hypothetical protein